MKITDQAGQRAHPACETSNLSGLAPLTYPPSNTLDIDSLINPILHAHMLLFFFLNDPPPPKLSPLPLHAPLPIPPPGATPPRRSAGISPPTRSGICRSTACWTP